MDGGRVAARGFQYQYTRTLESLVSHLENPEAGCVRVEGPPPGSGAVDAVDFDVLGHDDAVLYAAQVKSKSPGKPLGATDALRILAKLVAHQDARAYVLLTNAAPGIGIAELVRALESTGCDANLRGMLGMLPGGSTQRTDLILGFDDGALTRLRRCRVEFDERSEEEIRSQLRASLRTYRNRAHTGLGDESAGLLSGYLISEILRRAADVHGRSARFPIEELRRLLLVDRDVLTRALGRRDWGIVVGTMPAPPDVTRTTLAQQLTSTLPATTAPTIRRAALVGPSGIGKSSLAAHFIAERADAYDVIGWIECETADAVAASFQRLVTALDPQAAEAFTGQHSLIRDAAHLAFSRLAGRWLLVFDNAGSPRQIEQWIPPTGSGDVIVCTLNAAENLGITTKIDISTMERTESTELLSRRLRLDAAGRDIHQHALDRLADGLGDWPLALELGAGYLTGCGIPLEKVGYYLQQLAIRSMDDIEGTPPGYPRTLAAALGMCLEQLEHHVRTDQGNSPKSLATLILYASAFLSSHQIPGHLLLATIADDADSAHPSHRGPLIVPPDLVNLGEVIRELHRFSIVKDDLALAPSFGDQVHDAERTIAVNTIIQALLRARLRAPQIDRMLHDLLWHVERWLSAATTLGEMERAQTMCSHAGTLLAHCVQAGVQNNRVNLLFGNLAGFYQLTGEIEQAETLLLRELAQLDVADNDGESLMVQTRLALAALAINHFLINRGRRPLRTSLRNAVEHLEIILGVTRKWFTEFPAAAKEIATEVGILLQHPAVHNSDETALPLLARVFDDLASRLPDTVHSANTATARDAELSIQDGQYAAAEHRCRLLLAQSPAGRVEVEARRLLIEALCRQARWAEAIKEVSYWQNSPQAPRLYWASILQCIHNAGLGAVEAYAEGDVGGARLLTSLTAWPGLEKMLAAAEPHDQADFEHFIALGEFFRTSLAETGTSAFSDSADTRN